MDLKGVTKVGGRIDRSNINEECKHPVILPKESQMSKRNALWCHQRTRHAGRV